MERFSIPFADGTSADRALRPSENWSYTGSLATITPVFEVQNLTIAPLRGPQ